MEYVKENVVFRPPVSPLMLACALGATLAALAGVSLIDLALPTPLMRADAPPERFIAEVAHEHLVNLTSIGPRVAGTYENEVLAVGVLVEAIKGIARSASPHNHVEIDLHRASGSFSLSFFDGMNNVYRDVQSVVARVRGAGGGARTALLLNCHFDTVPDSPGASDDGAGCAVLLEVLRALAAARRPLRHAAVFLFNGAEENIMQASHAFITQHKWAKQVRAFINIEACGAGGREVLFQAGPHDPWIMEVYAGSVPHPYASSLAQELFESGLIPADTDFRIFRDFGGLSGVDLAWSANGYVYHTRLDTAERVPPASLQRTGDNVLALTHGLLASPRLESAVDRGSRPGVFFDVLGLALLSARGPPALAAAAAALALALLSVALAARDARRQLYISSGAWYAAVCGEAGRALRAAAAGAGAAAAAAAALHAAGARLAFYSRAWLLAPLYALPALAVAAATLRANGTARAGGVAARLVAGARGGGGRRVLLGGAAAGLRAAAAAHRVRARAVAAARAGRRRRLRCRCHRCVARGVVGGRRAAAAAADVLPGAGLARHVRARAGPRRLPARAARRAAGAGGGGAGAGGLQLAAAARGRRAGRQQGGGGAARCGRCVVAAGAVRRRRGLQRVAAAAPHAVPRAPQRARPGRARHRPPVLDPRARRQHAARARRLRARAAGGARDRRRGLRALALLRRALLPARAAPRAARALAARPAAPAARRPRRPRSAPLRAHRAQRRAPPPRAHARGDTPQHHRAESHSSDYIPRRGRARRVEQRPRRAAGGRALGLAPHALPVAARRPPPPRLAPRAAPAHAGAGRGRAGGAVGGGARHGRGSHAAARGAAGLVPAARRAHRLARAPAPAARVAAPPPPPPPSCTCTCSLET